jgi:hypothetical protein
MDCVAGETLRRQIVYALLVELVITYKKDQKTQKKSSL